MINNSNHILVILVNYHCEDDIIQLINHEQLAHVDIAIADNSQSERLASIYSTHDRVKYHRTEANLGFAGGINTFLKHHTETNYEYYFLLNPDVEFTTPDLISKLLTTAKEHELNLLSPTVIDCEHNEYPLPNRRNKLLTNLGVLPQIPDREDNLIHSHHLPGCALLLSSEVVDSIGCFDERFFMYGEEVEYCYRAVQHGYTPTIHRGITIKHDQPSGSLRHPQPYQAYYRNRNPFLIARSRFSKRKRLIFYSVELVSLVTRVNQIVRNEPSSVLFSLLLGVWDGVRGKYGKRRYL